MKIWPATVSVPERELQLVFAATDQVTVPLPVPLVGVQVSQLGALLDGVHAQPAPAVTVIDPLPAAEPALAVAGDTAYVQAAPACVTEKTCPAIVSVPERGLVLALAATE